MRPTIPQGEVAAWLDRAADLIELRGYNVLHRDGISIPTAISRTAPPEATVYYPGGGSTQYNAIALDALAAFQGDRDGVVLALKVDNREWSTGQAVAHLHAAADSLRPSRTLLYVAAAVLVALLLLLVVFA